ncbi:META domain-containing protein [Pricia sp.]|uniref:META domain-containing protein n=1 Tax=Pricia sp. TaxID=2268138 RepID=UPI0035934E8A
MAGKSLVGLFISAAFVVAACGDKKQKTEVQRPVTSGDSVAKRTQNVFVNNDGERIIFKASGTEPFWGLEITEKAIRFTSMVQDLEKFSAPATEPIRAADANVKMYKAEIEAGTVRAQVVQAECTNDMSGKISGYKVKVEIKQGADKEFTVFEGCGEYVTDYRLNDIWVLEEMEGKPVQKEDFQEDLPNMEIHTSGNKFMGHAGCNRMNGKIFGEGNLLRFIDIATTRMLCQSGNQEELFLKNLRASTHFEIRDNRLFLNNPDGPTMVFKKMD